MLECVGPFFVVLCSFNPFPIFHSTMLHTVSTPIQLSVVDARFFWHC